MVLVVEDEPDGADVVTRMLRSVGITGVVVGSGEEALATLEVDASIFAGAVIDLALPAMDGLELMSILRQQASTANLPLVAITAFHTPELKAKALDDGFDAYFAKPLDGTIFAQTLEKMFS
jgi:CheY-like chemotaxis protein